VINITGARRRAQLQAAIENQMQALERVFMLIVQKQLKKQYSAAASRVESGSDKISSAVDRNKKEFQRVIQAQYIRTAKRFAPMIFDNLSKAKGIQIKSIETEFDAFVWKWAKQIAAQKVVDVSNATKKKIAAVIMVGREEGLSSAAIGRNIRKDIIPIDTVYRAERIARTETHTAAVGGMTEAMETTGLTYTKEWAAARDARTRDSHIAADGQEVAQDKPFIVDGEELMYPGDANGSAGNIINCRCVVFYNTK